MIFFERTIPVSSSWTRQGKQCTFRQDSWKLLIQLFVKVLLPQGSPFVTVTNGDKAPYPSRCECLKGVRSCFLNGGLGPAVRFCCQPDLPWKWKMNARPVRFFLINKPKIFTIIRIVPFHLFFQLLGINR